MLTAAHDLSEGKKSPGPETRIDSAAYPRAQETPARISNREQLRMAPQKTGPQTVSGSRRGSRHRGGSNLAAHLPSLRAHHLVMVVGVFRICIPLAQRRDMRRVDSPFDV